MMKWIYRGNIVIAAVSVGVFFLSFFIETGFEFTANFLLFSIFFLFIDLWVVFIVQKNVIMAMWLPTVVLFLMGRPIAFVLIGESWTYHGLETTRYYLFITFLSACGIGLPTFWNLRKGFVESVKKNKCIPVAVLVDQRDMICEKFSNIKKKCNEWIDYIFLNKEKNRTDPLFYAIIVLGYGITFGCYLLTKIVEYMGMRGKSYLEYYLARDIGLPWIVTFLSAFSMFFMCFLLAVARKKMTVFIVLTLNVLSTIPVLLIGQRNPFVLSLLFFIAVLYIKRRELHLQRINKKQAIILMVCVLIVLLIFVWGMDFLSNSRNGIEEGSSGFLRDMLGFVSDQGYTYETICQGINYREYLRSQDNNCYTFSAVVDYYTYGRLGNLLWGTSPIPGGNNADRAFLSHDLAHKISYLILGENYLKGQGIGTSYVIETFLDFGFFGVFIVNLFYGFFLSKMSTWFGERPILDCAFVYVLLKVYFIGRDNALIPFSGMLTVHFFVFVIGVYLIYYLTSICSKRKRCEK